MEIINLGQEVDLGGYTLRWQDDVGTSGYTIDNTLLGSGKVIAFIEGSGTNSDSIIYGGFNLGQVDDRVDVVLLDPSNTEIDALITDDVSYSQNWTGLAFNRGFNDAIYRMNTLDSNKASDWFGSYYASTGAVNPNQEVAAQSGSGLIAGFAQDTVLAW